MTMATHTIDDGRRTVDIDGELLAFSSSRQIGKPRWLELTLYQLDDGDYMLTGVGKSDVEGETDRAWAHRCTSAEEVVERLYMRDRDSIRYLTRSARVLLRLASVKDGDIAKAYEFDLHTGAPGRA